MNRRAFLFGAAAVAAAASLPRSPVFADGGRFSGGPITIGERGAEVFVPHARAIFGKARVGGDVILAQVNGHGQRALHIAHVIAPHELQSIDAIWLGDDRVELDQDGVCRSGRFAGLVTVNRHLGRADQPADRDLIAAFPDMVDEDCRVPGLAWTYTRATFDEKAFPCGWPCFAVDVTGKDPQA